MKIKEKAEDFVVEEITPEGKLLEAGGDYDFIGGEGEHLIFIMEKKNWDTINAARELCKRLGVSQKRLGYAGTKDRTAWTTQRMSLWNTKKEGLEQIHIKDITLKPLEHGGRVKLGDLQGNRFTITIRGVTGKPVLPGNVMNLFGEQRFGGTRPVTHLVGKAIVNNRLKEAVETYLWKTFPTERQEDSEARQRLAQEKDFAQALRYFPKHLKYERSMLGHLCKHQNDYAGALRALPRKLLVMFVHAYQAELFNMIVKKRQGIGFEAIPGDVLENGVPTAPLFGFASQLADGKQGEMEKNILEQEWLELESFKTKAMPDLASPGMRRKMLVTTEDFQVLEKGAGWARIRFSLPKGCYATTVLEQIEWEE
ncbi:MAG: tRNA pseudouridine(13) synthase TruD [Candidatus Diapherotrites archaeon]|nr:tRNA pseudouridine(13) synthase TruD [Candidatus Diapherotrites archaeon]